MKKFDYHYYLYVVRFVYLLSFLSNSPRLAQYMDLDGPLLSPTSPTEKHKKQEKPKLEKKINQKKSPPKKELIFLKNLKIDSIFKWMKASQEGANVLVNWKYADKLHQVQDLALYKITLYRFTKVPVSTNNLHEGIVLSNIVIDKDSLHSKKNETRFYDTINTTGIYNYALFVSKREENRPLDLKEGVNLVTSINVKLHTNHIFKSMQAVSGDKKQVVEISWEYDKEFVNNSERKYSRSFDRVKKKRIYRTALYRFTDIPTSLDDLNENSLLKEFFDNETSYEDIPKKTGIYHYAVFLWKKDKVYPKKFRKNINFITNIQLRIRSLELSFENFKEILKEYYYKKDYENAIKQLTRYKKASNDNMKATALFYIGLSFFRIGQYKKSISYFSHPLVVQSHKIRAKFWKKRAFANSEVNEATK